MPEHVHLLIDEPPKDTLATFLQIFKQLTARELKSADQKQFWQRRYYDFNVSSSEKFVEKLRYIHRNPVVRGLVAKPEDYRWSSFNPLHYWRNRTSRNRIGEDSPPPRARLDC
jgi:putative transposase